MGARCRKRYRGAVGATGATGATNAAGAVAAMVQRVPQARATGFPASLIILIKVPVASPSGHTPSFY